MHGYGIHIVGYSWEHSTHCSSLYTGIVGCIYLCVGSFKHNLSSWIFFSWKKGSKFLDPKLLPGNELPQKCHSSGASRSWRRGKKARDRNGPTTAAIIYSGERISPQTFFFPISLFFWNVNIFSFFFLFGFSPSLSLSLFLPKFFTPFSVPIFLQNRIKICVNISCGFWTGRHWLYVLQCKQKEERKGFLCVSWCLI